jgi:hypothetical protein
VRQRLGWGCFVSWFTDHAGRPRGQELLERIPRELARAFTIIAVVHTDSALGSFSLNNGDTTDEESLSEADLAFLLWGLINPPNKEHCSRMYEYGYLDTTIHLT